MNPNCTATAIPYQVWKTLPKPPGLASPGTHASMTRPTRVRYALICHAAGTHCPASPARTREPIGNARSYVTPKVHPQGHFRSAEHEDSIHLDRWYIYPPLRATLAVLVWGVKRELKIGQRRVGDANGWSLTLAYSVSVAGACSFVA